MASSRLGVFWGSDYCNEQSAELWLVLFHFIDKKNMMLRDILHCTH